MKRTTMLTLLTIACLTTIPSIAQARYRDGMNLYEYVRSAPTNHVDWNGAAAQSTSKPASQPTSRPVDELKKLSGATDKVMEVARTYLMAPKEWQRFNSWKAKRGTIHFAMTLHKHGMVALPGAKMVMDFVPDKDTGGCCDIIEILQFIHSKKDNRPFFTDPEAQNKKRSYKGWHVDRITGKPGKSPYLAGQVKRANPGRAGKNAKPLVFGDSPWLNEQMVNDQLVSPRQLGQALVTCVACVKGPDAKKAGGVDIYGCVTWGWFWQRSSGTRDEIFKVLGPQFSKKLRMPKIFGEVIKRWNADTHTEHRVHYKGEVSTEKK